jgi:thiamine biosynthesis lipoprotein
MRPVSRRHALLAPLLAACAAAPVQAPAPPREAPSAPPVDLPVFTETRPSMSTLVTVTIAGADPAAAAAGAGAAFAIFSRVDEVMNEWRPASPLSALNAAAGNGALVPLPADLCEVLRAGKDGAARTGGLFDPTWAALRGLWRFGDGERFTVPAAEALAAACPLVSWRDLEIEPAAGAAGEPCRARLLREGMQVGLGGLAKGWGVDRAAAELRRRGLADFTVQAGGDLYAAGTRGGRPWRVGVRDPRGAPGEPFARLEVRDAAFSTTGDSERFAIVDGVRLHHVLDPRTCRPATASRQVTVLAPTALDAEILGKAVFILGGEQGLALAARWGASVVVVEADGGVRASPSLSGRLETIRPPVR